MTDFDVDFMTDSEKDPEMENKNIFKRFKINLKTSEIEKSDFNEKLSDNNYDKENIPNLNRLDKNSNEKEMINEFDDQYDTLENNGTNRYESHHDENIDQELLFFKENEDIDETFPLSSKIKEIISKDSERKFSILPILGLAIGILFIIMGVLILLGDSEKVVDNVISGEASAFSLIINFIGIIFILLSLSKIFPKKGVFGNFFHVINDFESGINENNEDNGINETKPKSKNDDSELKR